MPIKSGWPRGRSDLVAGLEQVCDFRSGRFDLHLGQGMFCMARSVGEAALDPIARGDRMRNAVYDG
jgi:hypothetical protein